MGLNGEGKLLFAAVSGDCFCHVQAGGGRLGLNRVV